MLKIGIIREGKVPPDSRVVLSPAQCKKICQEMDVDIVVQASDNRCFSDDAYRAEGIKVSEDLDDASLLLGVKEVPIEQLIPHKTYCFFSHTIKEQPYNRELLRAILAKNIRLVDYEVLKDDRGRRVIAFGVFAGMVGAHNGLMAYGRRTGAFDLPRMYSFEDYAAAQAYYKSLKMPPVKIVLTGTGRVGRGAHRVLVDMGVEEVAPEDFLQNEYSEAVFCQVDSRHYVVRKDGGPYIKSHFYEHPEDYESSFLPYTQAADIMINGIYWDNEAPAFFTLEQMRSETFRIKVIADITCDIAPVSSIPSTIRASTIADPIFGFDPKTGAEVEAHGEGVIDMMSVDNLPNELPRDASVAFGEQFITRVLPEFLQTGPSAMLEGATITRHGKLTERFAYLENYVAGD